MVLSTETILYSVLVFMWLLCGFFSVIINSLKVYEDEWENFKIYFGRDLQPGNILRLLFILALGLFSLILAFSMPSGRRIKIERKLRAEHRKF